MKKNKLTKSQKRKKWIQFVQTLTHTGNCPKFRSPVKELSTNNAKSPANRAIYFDAKKTTPRHDPSNCANNFNQQYTTRKMKNSKETH